MTTTQSLRQSISDTFPTMAELDTEISRVQAIAPITPGGIANKARRLELLSDIRNYRIVNS
jgi:hypothetical protein